MKKQKKAIRTSKQDVVVVTDTVGLHGHSERDLGKGHNIAVKMGDGQIFTLEVKYTKKLAKGGWLWMAFVKKGDGVKYSKYRLQKAHVSL
jgi:hypothetical protein